MCVGGDMGADLLKILEWKSGEHGNEDIRITHGPTQAGR
jgi:hypothetical protein